MSMKFRDLALLICGATIFVPGVLQAQTVTISPGYTNLGVNQTLQYTATVTGLTNTAVTWSVTGVVGGNATNGRITQAGLYTAPATIPTDGVLIEALASDGKTLGVVYVNIAPPGPTITAISPSPIPTGNYSITLTGSGFQSGAIVQAVGANMPTTFVNSTTLTANGYQGPPGAVVFTAINPGSLWGPGFTATFVTPGPQVISPTTASVQFGATQQFTSAGATSWTATAGTITSSGLYTAPAVMPASGKATVTATGPGGSAKATVTVVNPNPQAIAPATVSLILGATQQFTSAGATNWKADNGTITATGFYTAAATMPASGKDTVTVTGPNGTATATVTLIALQAIAPTSVTLKFGATQQFTSASATSWTATAGTVTSSGLYTAPAVMPASGTATVTATGPGGSANATVTVTNPAAQAIAPTTVSLILGATQQFTSAGATSWKAVYGIITAAGFYTTPAILPASGSDTVTVTGTNGTAAATVTLIAPQVIAPTTVTLNFGATQQFTSAGATSWSATAGTVTSSGLYTAPAVMPASGTATVTATGPGGSANATVTVTNPTPQAISPASVTLTLGATQQFTSALATSWKAVSGTITAAGLYNTPAALPASGKDTVTVIGANGTATATVTLVDPTPVITSVGDGTLPLGILSATITGTGFLASAVAQLNGTALTTAYSGGALTVSGFYGQSGMANITVSNGSVVSQPFPVQIGIANAQVSAAAARRFLEQAAFGPTPTDAATVQTVGYQSWLNTQFNMAPVSNYNIVVSDQGGMPSHFLTNAVSNPDQLRQRVAFALSQIFVTSIQKLIWNGNMVLFQNMLLNDAFTNYRQIMGDVTLSPAMGQYLDIANNAMADPATGSLANENYARELMQLFTTGVYMLNPDGSIQYDATNNPLPTYSQFTVTEFARVFTGWTYAPQPGNTAYWGEYISGYPLIPFPSEHDSGSKQLLNGYVSPAGITPLQDLNNALDNIFNHPNVGPFVGKQLIQHLVKSNPSPAYVSRVAAAFNNNGSGVRGDMQAAITAVLMDPEARANDNGGNDQPTDGHLQEPALFISAMVRAFGGQMTDENYYSTDMANMGQDIFNPASVFNYYAPNYGVPATSLMGGEFQIHTPNNAIYRANVVHNLFGQYSNPVQSYGPGTTVDLTAYVPLAPTPATLVNALDLALTHGVMPAAMKSAIVSAIAADNLGSLHQVENACYLILTSSYYNVWH
jgi:uncharacterized protein (DUF1800 family)